MNDNHCQSCGMLVPTNEYHPFALCKLVEVLEGDTRSARINLAAVIEDARKSPGWLEYRIDTFLANVRKERRP